MIAGGAAGILGLVALVAALEPAPPVVDQSTVWTDAVRHGEMVRQVRGSGTLVAEQVWWVTATTSGRVERVLVEPGTVVTAGTVLLELSNPDVEQQALEAERQLAALEAETVIQRGQLELERLSQASSLAALQFEHREAMRLANIDEELLASRIVAPAAAQRSREREAELLRRVELEESRIEVRSRSMEAQLRINESQAQRLRESAALHRSRVKALKVTAPIDGVVQEITAQNGQMANGVVGRIVAPDRLKAVLRVPEVQARDVTIGQEALIDTRAGVVSGRVWRIDPAAQGGTVAMDVVFDGPLPRGARPDLSVDGTIEIERIPDVLYVTRPVFAEAGGIVSLFRVDPGGQTATRVDVQVGRSSVNAIEVIAGLEQGDVVILSDMSRWSEFDRVRLR